MNVFNNITNLVCYAATSSEVPLLPETGTPHFSVSIPNLDVLLSTPLSEHQATVLNSEDGHIFTVLFVVAGACIYIMVCIALVKIKSEIDLQSVKKDWRKYANLSIEKKIDIKFIHALLSSGKPAAYSLLLPADQANPKYAKLALYEFCKQSLSPGTPSFVGMQIEALLTFLDATTNVIRCGEPDGFEEDTSPLLDITKKFKQKFNANPIIKLYISSFLDQNCHIQDKLALAQELIDKSPNTLARSLLLLFSETEITAHYPAIATIIKNCSQSCFDVSDRLYLKYTKMFIHSLNRPPLLNDGVFWQCIGQEKNGPGINWFFKLRSKYDAKTKSPQKMLLTGQLAKNAALKNRKIFPAVEIFPGEPIRESQFNQIARKIRNNPIFEFIGYKVETGESGCYITIPDRTAIISGWNRLRKMPGYRHLPPLTIASSMGVATHEEYIKTFLTHDLLLATGTEFIHDQLVHVIDTLDLMSRDPIGYLRIKSAEREVVRNSCRLIKKLRKKNENEGHCKIMDFTIGALVDNLVAVDTIDQKEELLRRWDPSTAFVDSFIYHIWKDSSRWREKLIDLGITNPDHYPASRIYEFWLAVHSQAF